MSGEGWVAMAAKHAAWQKSLERALDGVARHFNPDATVSLVVRHESIVGELFFISNDAEPSVVFLAASERARRVEGEPLEEDAAAEVRA